MRRNIRVVALLAAFTAVTARSRSRPCRPTATARSSAGPPDAEEPAAQVKLTAAEGEAATAHGGGQGAREQAQLAAVAASERGADRANTLAVIVLVVGALGLLAGAGALVVARRSRATA